MRLNIYITKKTIINKYDNNLFTILHKLDDESLSSE